MKLDANNDKHLVILDKHGKIDFESFDSGIMWHDRGAERRQTRINRIIAVLLVVGFLVLLWKTW